MRLAPRTAPPTSHDAEPARVIATAKGFYGTYRAYPDGIAKKPAGAGHHAVPPRAPRHSTGVVRMAKRRPLQFGTISCAAASSPLEVERPKDQTHGGAAGGERIRIRLAHGPYLAFHWPAFAQAQTLSPSPPRPAGQLIPSKGGPAAPLGCFEGARPGWVLL